VACWPPEVRDFCSCEYSYMLAWVMTPCNLVDGHSGNGVRDSHWASHDAGVELCHPVCWIRELELQKVTSSCNNAATQMTQETKGKVPFPVSVNDVIEKALCSDSFRRSTVRVSIVGTFSGGPSAEVDELCLIHAVLMDATEKSGRSSWQLACSLCAVSLHSTAD
jgi:hypothetical protein